MRATSEKQAPKKKSLSPQQEESRPLKKKWSRVSIAILVAAVAAPVIHKLLLPNDLKQIICTLTYCTKQVMACSDDFDCGNLLQCFKECNDANSRERRESKKHYHYLQHPEDPLPCFSTCLGKVGNNTAAERFLECNSKAQCGQPSRYSDTCAAFPQEAVLKFTAVPPNVLAGVWYKHFTNSWDDWSCQTATFYPPISNTTSSGNWRVEFNWTVENVVKQPWYGNVTTVDNHFWVSETIMPHERWSYPNGTLANPTHKTELSMWGGTIHENWYLLDYNERDDVTYLIYHVCAWSLGTKSFDATTLVLTKQKMLSNEQSKHIQTRAREVLGEIFGILQPLRGCK